MLLGWGKLYKYFIFIVEVCIVLVKALLCCSSSESSVSKADCAAPYVWSTPVTFDLFTFLIFSLLLE